MSDPSGPETLSATSDLVVAVRVVLSPGGKRVRGLLVDVEGCGDRPFVGLSGLCEVLGEWLAEAQGRHAGRRLEQRLEDGE